MNSSLKVEDPFVPSEKDVELAGEASRALAVIMGSHKDIQIELKSDHEKPMSLILPTSVVTMVQKILTEMSNGNAITVIPVNAELTTQESADFLNVSRPFFIKQLESGLIKYRKVGTHRRINVNDLLAYKHNVDSARLKTLDELTSEAERLNLGY